MKTILSAFLILLAIITMQIGLTYAFSFRVGELFSKTAITAVYVYCLCGSMRKRKAV